MSALRTASNLLPMRPLDGVADVTAEALEERVRVADPQLDVSR